MRFSTAKSIKHMKSHLVCACVPPPCSPRQESFFCRVLEVMADPDIALCLTPQNFDDVKASYDIFNCLNLSFWEYMLPGATTRTGRGRSSSRLYCSTAAQLAVPHVAHMCQYSM